MKCGPFRDRHPTLDLVGRTPLVETRLFADSYPKAKVLAKLEMFNPGGSVKDRPVARMLTHAQAQGRLHPGQTILDSSSGNAGIAYAMIGSLLGHNVEIVMPDNASRERVQRIMAHGATITFTDAILGYDEAMREVKRRYESSPEDYYFADQYSNAANWEAHYDGTAAEIISQAPAAMTHFLAGVGTGGTITGVARRLSEVLPDVQIVCAAPPEFPGVEGLKPLGADHLVPEIFDASIVDRWVDLDVDRARDFSVRLAAEGLFVGQSSGAYMYAAESILQDDPHAVIVTLFPDAGDRYFSTGLWDVSPALNRS
jgi:cysteine synthase B